MKSMEKTRDKIAFKAMKFLLSEKVFDFDKYKTDPKRVAWWAYDLADAMLSVRDESKQTLQKKEKK